MKHFRTYKSLCTDFYDIDKPMAPPEELAFYMHYVKEARGRILEPMCGSGRFLIPILEHGFTIDGIDASRYMLDSLRKKCERKKLIPLLHETLLQKARLDKKYALVIIPTGSICLLTNKEDVEQSLQVLADAMVPGAKLVFEFETESMLSQDEKNCRSFCGRFVRKSDESLIILSTFPHFDVETQIETTICKYELVQKNQIVQTEVEEFCLKLYKPGEMENVLIKSGFENIREYKPYEFCKAKPTDPTIIIECSKGEK